MFPVSEPAGFEALVRLDSRQKSKSVPPLKRRVHLSCLSKKDGTRKKDTPAPRPPRILRSGSACGDGIFRWHIRVPAKNDVHPPPSRGQALHIALRVYRHRPPLRRGPFGGSASMRSRARCEFPEVERGHQVRGLWLWLWLGRAGCPLTPGASFWFRLSATRQKDEPVRFSGRNALL